MAIIGTKGSGVWEYSTDGGASWQDVDKVSGGKALFLDADAKIRFTADSPVLPGSATFSFKAWDRTKGTVGTRGPATGTAVSRQTEVVTTAVANHKPSLDTTPDVGLPTSPLKAGVAVAKLLGKAMSDPDAPHFLQGIAIVAADNANGVWQYSLGHGVWLDMGIPTPAWHCCSRTAATFDLFRMRDTTARRLSSTRPGIGPLVSPATWEWIRRAV